MRQPGIHTDISAAEYHRDPAPAPSLSSSVGKILLDQSPLHAWTAHPKLNPQWEDGDSDPSRPKEIGTAGHKIALYKGAEITVIDADAWTTKAAKEARAAAYAAGSSPILAPDHKRAMAAAKALHDAVPADPDLAWAFDPSAGKSEVVLLWKDGDIYCRAMLDRVRIEGDRAVVVDLKFTADSAHPAAVSRRIYQMGYDFSAAFYRRGLAFVAPQVKQVKYIIATTETEAPYGFSSLDLDEATWTLSEKRIRAAVGLWDRCLHTKTWPGYPQMRGTAELPGWLETQWLERELNDELLSTRLTKVAALSDIHQRAGKGAVDLTAAG